VVRTALNSGALLRLLMFVVQLLSQVEAVGGANRSSYTRAVAGSNPAGTGNQRGFAAFNGVAPVLGGCATVQQVRWRRHCRAGADRRGLAARASSSPGGSAGCVPAHRLYPAVRRATVASVWRRGNTRARERERQDTIRAIARAPHRVGWGWPWTVVGCVTRPPGRPRGAVLRTDATTGRTGCCTRILASRQLRGPPPRHRGRSSSCRRSRPGGWSRSCWC
jgi:hypothetical protein